MRLLALVPCGCRAAPIDEAQPAAMPARETAAVSAGGSSGRRRRRAGRGRSRSLGEWRPSLGDIYEDGEAGKGGFAAGRTGKPIARDAARVLPRAHSDDIRHLDAPSSLPAYTPTAFLF